MFLVVLYDFLNDEPQECFGEIGVEIGSFRQVFEAFDLRGFATRIGRWKVVFRLEFSHGLRVLEALGQREDEDRIQPIYAVAMLRQDLCRAGNGIGSEISQGGSLSV